MTDLLIRETGDLDTPAAMFWATRAGQVRGPIPLERGGT
jgi:hypothetical protein